MPPDNERFNRITKSISEAAQAEEAAASNTNRFNQITGRKPGFISGLVAGVPFVGDRPDQDSSLPFRAGHMMTESAFTGFAAGKGASLINPVVNTTNRGLKIAEALRKSLAGSYQAGKARLIGTEAIIGAGSGTAGYYAVQEFPDSPIAQFVAELGGGLLTDVARQTTKELLTSAPVRNAARGTLNLLPSIVGARFVDRKLNNAPSRFINNARRGLDPTYATGRARERLERQGILESDANRIIDESGVETQRASGEFLPGAVDQMSFATRTGNLGLMQLEQDVMNSAKQDALSLASTQRLQELNDIIIRGFDFGDSNSFRQYMEVKDEYYKALLDASMEDVAQDINSRLARNGVTAANEEQANLIARSSLDKALTSARSTETALWEAIPSDIKFNTDNFAKLWQELKGGMTNVTRQTDTPITASWLEKIQFGKLKGQPRIGQTVTIQQARDVISQLRREARNATSAFGETNYNLARISNDLATKLNDDLSASITGLYGSADGPGDETLAIMEEAVAFSKNLNEQFRNPAIAGLLDTTESGANLVRNTEVLDHLFASPSKNRGNYDDLMNAVGDDPAVQGALTDYLKFSMFNQGGFDIPAAENFLKVNERLLDRMPALKNEITSAIQANDIALLKIETLPADFDPLLAATTLFIKQEPIAAIANVMGDVNPQRRMAEILMLAKEDKSGNALSGLQQSFSDYLLGLSSSSNQFASTGGNRFVDYNLLAETMRKPSVEALIPMVFDAPQQRRLSQIRATARRMQMQRDAAPTTEGIQGDLASQLLTMAARLGGARVGGQLGSASMGGSLQSAAVVSRWLQDMAKASIENPSEKLIQMAVLDEELFKALFRTSKDAEAGKAAEETVSTAVRYLTRGAGSRAASTETLLVEPFTEERDRRTGAIPNQ